MFWNKLFKKKLECQYYTSEFGNYYAKAHFITPTFTEKGDCARLRTILNEDLNLTIDAEIEGEGGLWWDFKYHGVSFTVEFLVEQVGGSEFYPTSCTKSTYEERLVLKDLMNDIIYSYSKRYN